MKKQAKAAERRERKARKRAIQDGVIPDPREQFGDRIDPATIQPEAFQDYPTHAERREMRERAMAEARRDGGTDRDQKGDRGGRPTRRPSSAPRRDAPRTTPPIRSLRGSPPPSGTSQGGSSDSGKPDRTGTGSRKVTGNGSARTEPKPTRSSGQPATAEKDQQQRKR